MGVVLGHTENRYPPDHPTDADAMGAVTMVSCHTPSNEQSGLCALLHPRRLEQRHQKRPQLLQDIRQRLCGECMAGEERLPLDLLLAILSKSFTQSERNLPRPDRSCQALQIGTHHVGDPIALCIVPERVQAHPPC